jgi:hypothetical protein
MDSFIKSAGLMFIAGRFTVILWMLIISSYNVWQWDRTVIVTIIGWGALLKWLHMLVLPNKFGVMMWKLGNNLNKIAGIFVLVLGVALTYCGFFL